MGTRHSEEGRSLMRVAAALLAAVFLSTGCSPGGGRAKGPELDWITDYDKGLAEAKAAGKPVMIDFFATWCGPCKMLDRSTYSDPKVIEQSRSVVAVRIDVDKNEALARRYNIESIPTIVFLNPDGKEVAREIGFTSASTMIDQMRRARPAKL